MLSLLLSKSSYFTISSLPRLSLGGSKVSLDSSLNKKTDKISISLPVKATQTSYKFCRKTQSRIEKLGVNIAGEEIWATLERHGKRTDIANRTTWIVIHGWNSHPRDINKLVQAIDAYSNQDQVLILNWCKAAASPVPYVRPATAWIQTVAKFAVGNLNKWKISPANINIVGHSLGAYIAYEIATELKPKGGISKLIALDPAAQVPSGYKTRSINFANGSVNWSWAFYGSAFGSDKLAMTADESFQLCFNNFNPQQNHGAVVNAFVSLLEKNNQRRGGNITKLFNLNKMNPWGKPWRIGQGFESKITFKDNGGGSWEPKNMEYLDSSRQRVTKSE